MPSVCHPCAIRAPSVYRLCTVRVPSLYHPCTIRVPSVYHPCTHSFAHPLTDSLTGHFILWLFLGHRLVISWSSLVPWSLPGHSRVIHWSFRDHSLVAYWSRPGHPLVITWSFPGHSLVVFRHTHCITFTRRSLVGATFSKC